MSSSIFDTIMVLYDYSGNTSNFFRDKGYSVIQVESQLDYSNAVRMLFKPGLKLKALICYPPCTYFSRARSRPEEFDLDYGLSTLDLCFRMFYLYRPDIFIIENPFHSRIRNYIGNPKQRIDLGCYGFPSQKPTGLWGIFTPVPPGTKLVHTGKLDNLSKNKRTETPIQLIEAIYKSNF